MFFAIHDSHRWVAVNVEKQLQIRNAVALRAVPEIVLELQRSVSKQKIKEREIIHYVKLPVWLRQSDWHIIITKSKRANDSKYYEQCVRIAKH